MNPDIDKPLLIEPGVKYFLNEMLKQTHIFRKNYQNTLFNLLLMILFILILGSILVYKYKGKLTPLEKQDKDIAKQQYILTKIKNLQIAKKIAHQELITGLPNWENDYLSVR